MRALTITALIPASSRRPIRSKTSPSPRRAVFGRLFARRKPTLFHRCLAVHMATAGTLSALR
jgi:hypothetical protein